MTFSNESNQWFAHWFDSPFYHILYGNRDHSEAADFIDRLVDFLQLSPGTPVLDLACGKGRHSLRLAQNKLVVHGIDLSPKSIAHAKVHSTEHLTFAVHDMRKVYLENTFDVVFNLFTSFGYFDNLSENQKVLEAINKELKSKGKLVLDFMNTNFVLQHMVAEATKSVSGIDFHIQKKVVNGIILKNIAFEHEGQSYQYEERVQALTLADFKQLLDHSGFELTHTFGNYHLAPYHQKQSDRLILVAQKQ